MLPQPLEGEALPLNSGERDKCLLLGSNKFKLYKVGDTFGGVGKEISGEGRGGRTTDGLN